MSERNSNRVNNYLVEMPGSRWKDVGGQAFGRLTALEPTGDKKNGQHVWLCECTCGNLKRVPIGSLTGKPGVKSCGCLVREAAASTRHGMTGTPIHTRWWGIVQRCSQPSHRGYKYYGGRGIKVCERWLTFENFYADMGEPPFPTAQIDRKDNDGDYEPTNCQWLSLVNNLRKAHVARKERRQKSVPPYTLNE